MASVLVLSAGFGTRLLPLTEAIPKPLLPVGDRPLLAHTLQEVLRIPRVKVAVNAHHASDILSSYLDILWPTVNVSREEKILGTAGGVRAARRFFEPGHVLVVNGDIHGRLPLPEMLAAEDADLLLAVVPRPLGEGTVGAHRDGRVTRLRGERFGQEDWSGDYMGVMRVGSRALELLPEVGCLIGDVALPLLRSASAGVRVLPVEGPFLDVGSLATYHRANLGWLRAEGRDAYVADTAVVSEATPVADSLLHSGVVVGGAGEVRRVIALDGARFDAPLADAIVLPDGRVVRAEG